MQGQCNLYLWTLDPTLIEVICKPRPMHLLNLMAKGQWVGKLLVKICFGIQSPCHHNLLSLDTKIIRVHLLAKTNASIKFYGHWLSNYWLETNLAYKVNVTLTFEPLTPKSIGSSTTSKTNASMKFKVKVNGKLSISTSLELQKATHFVLILKKVWFRPTIGPLSLKWQQQ